MNLVCRIWMPLPKESLRIQLRHLASAIQHATFSTENRRLSEKLAAACPNTANMARDLLGLLTLKLSTSLLYCRRNIEQIEQP